MAGRLREPADAEARSAALGVREVRKGRTAGATMVVHDLGSGSGSMGRWLAPRLDGRQHWVLHDHDPHLLARAVVDPPTAADGSAVTVEARQGDVTGLRPGDLAGASLVTASALLDMLTAEELESGRAVAASPPRLPCAGDALGRRPGRGSAPQTPWTASSAPPSTTTSDARPPAAPRSGPDAVGLAAELFRSLGAEVVTRPSPWRLDARNRHRLGAEWFEGWVGAACEQRPELAGEAGAYRDRRLAQAAAGELAVTVDHADLLVLP